MSNKQVEDAVREGTTPDVNVSAVQLRKQIRELTQQRDNALNEVRNLQKRVEYLQSLEQQYAENARRIDITVNMLRRDMGLIVEIARSNARNALEIAIPRVDESYRRGG